MTPRLTARHTAHAIYLAAIVSSALAATLWYAVTRGQDFNWDQQNYHIGIPFLLAHGTFWKSILPVGIQSYFNPCLPQVQFWAIRHLSPIGFAVALGVLQSTAFMIAGLICADIAGVTRTPKALPLGLLAYALCLMAPISLSEAGTTLFDLITAVPVLAAYALLLTRGRWLRLRSAALAAGALLGAATALKLTNGVFALGVAGFALAGPEKLTERIQWLTICGIAAILAFILVGGHWYLAVWERFGNPFFPYYNGIFRSPDFPPISVRDERFLPHSVLDIWRYPLYWLHGGSPTAGIASPSAELAFLDARWIIAIGGATLFLIALPILLRRSRRLLAEPALGLLFAFVISYLIWLAVFGIQRYAIPLEILCGAVILVLVTPVRPYLARVGLLSVIALISWRRLLVPDWGHLPWRPYWQSINPETTDLGGPAIVFISGKPNLFVAASLSPDARYVGIDGYMDLGSSNDTSLTRQLKQELADPAWQLKELDEGAVPDATKETLASYGLSVAPRCQPLKVANRTFRLCDVERVR